MENFKFVLGLGLLPGRLGQGRLAGKIRHPLIGDLGALFIIMRHALKPALMPIVTLLGMSFAGLLGGALITEIVFGLPGIGDLILTAVRTKDAPVVQASAVFLAVIYKVIMLLVDILQAIIDPRLKAQFK